MSDAHSNLRKFIAVERKVFESQYPDVSWSNSHWPVKQIFPSERDPKAQSLGFDLLKNCLKDKTIKAPPKGYKIPNEINDPIKAITYHIKRERNNGYSSACKYSMTLRTMFHFMFHQNLNDFTLLKNNHFVMVENYYKKYDQHQAYEISANLKVISNILDKFNLVDSLILFEPSISPGENKYYKRKLRKDELHEKEISPCAA